MKHLVIVLLTILLLPFHAYSQTNLADSSYYAYCEVLGTDIGLFKSKVVVTLDFGEERYESLYDNNGKAIRFHSMMGAINYMAKRNWKVKTTYVYNEGKQRVIHFLLEKHVTSASQIREGLITREARTTLTKEEREKQRNEGDGLYY